MAGLSGVSSTLRSVYDSIRTNCSVLLEKSKALAARVYLTVMNLFLQLKEICKNGLTYVLEAGLRLLGNSSQEKVGRLETELKLKSSAMQLLQVKYEALLASPHSLSTSDVSQLRRDWAKDRVQNALLKRETTDLRKELDAERVKLGVMERANKRLFQEVVTMKNQNKLVDPLQASGIL